MTIISVSLNDTILQEIDRIQHEHGYSGRSEVIRAGEDVTTTQIHSHLKNNKCLEIFVLEGESDRIKEMLKQFQTNRKMDLAKLIVP